MITTYLDDYGNKATIEKVEVFPYRGSPVKEEGFRLTCMATYENDFVFYVSVYETKLEALNKLSRFSNGTFKKQD